MVSPVTVSGLVAPLAVRVAPPPVQDAVYVVMADPPFEAGAVKAIDALALPAVPVPMVGAPGTPSGVALTLAEALPAPEELVAVTEQLYVVPLVRPVTVMGLVVPVCERLLPLAVQVAT